MPVSFFGETRNHEVLKPPRSATAWAFLFALLAALGMTGCVSKKTHIKAVDEAYARGKADSEPIWNEVEAENDKRIKAVIVNMERALEAERRKQPRDDKGRFIRVNGVEVDREGK